MFCAGTRGEREGVGMENKEIRLLEEWKANLDLLKFYETLKQQRFAHFLTIQTAFLAIFALLAKEAIGVFSLLTLAALVLVPIAPLVISFYFMRLDARGRAFVDTANTKLLLVEDEWKKLYPENHFSTYQHQFAVLSRRSDEIVDEYLGVRNLNDDPYKMLVQSASAHASEASILRLFWWLWIILFSSMLIHFGWHLANPSWRPASSSQFSGSGKEIPAGVSAPFEKTSMNVGFCLAI
jgi:hypothetical protein